MPDQIQEITDATFEMETLTKAMNNSSAALSSLVSDTVCSLNQNVVLNKEMEKKFEEVGIAVANGNDGAHNVKNTLDSMKDTVLAAGEATDVLLSKIFSVNRILKEINKITKVMLEEEYFEKINISLQCLIKFSNERRDKMEK